MRPTKNASGSPTVKKSTPLLTQRHWRRAGAVATAAAALLAWMGAEARFYLDSPLRCILHWGAFVVLLAITFLAVWLDLRYIRLMYAVQQRDIFRETLGDEQFRKALLSTPDEDHTSQNKHS